MLTVKQAEFQGVITRHWQPAWRSYSWTADGCGDNLYRDRTSALYAYNLHRCIPTLPVLNQKQVDAEWRAEGAMARAESR